MPIVKMLGTPFSLKIDWLDWQSWRTTKIMRVKGTGEPVWIDRDRIVYKLTEISDRHLQSIERWLLGRGAEDIPARKRAYDVGWYDIIRDELERRGLEPLQDHKDAFDEKVVKRTGDQSAAMAQRYKEIILAERGITAESEDYKYLLDSQFNDLGLDGKDPELAQDDEFGWDGENHPDLGRDF